MLGIVVWLFLAGALKILEIYLDIGLPFDPNQAHSMPVKCGNAIFVSTFLMYGLHFFGVDSPLGVNGRSKPWKNDPEHSVGF